MISRDKTMDRSIPGQVFEIFETDDQLRPELPASFLDSFDRLQKSMLDGFADVSKEIRALTRSTKDEDLEFVKALIPVQAGQVSDRRSSRA